MCEKSAKELREWLLFDTARKLVAHWPAGDVTHKDNPDIRIATTDGGYGIEITEVIRDELRKIEETRKKVCETARSVFLESLDVPGLAVSVAFNEHAEWQPVREQAAELCKIVRTCVNTVPQQKIYKELERDADFNTELFNEIWLHYLPSVSEALWQPISASFVPVLLAQHIQAVIDKKESKIPAYLKSVGRVSLLIGLEGFSASSAWSVDDAVLAHRFITKFDSVILLDRVLNRAHTLQITSAG